MKVAYPVPVTPRCEAAWQAAASCGSPVSRALPTAEPIPAARIVAKQGTPTDEHLGDTPGPSGGQPISSYRPFGPMHPVANCDL